MCFLWGKNSLKIITKKHKHKNLRIKKGTLIDVQSSIAEHSRVFGVYDVTGEWDSLILARFKNREEMDNFIKTTLSQEYIERTSTSLVLNTVKEEPRVLL